MSDRKKERAKNTARQRRNNENEQFRIIKDFLPFSKKTTDQLDKVSIIRLIISLLKYKEIAGRHWGYEDGTWNCHFKQALYGFIIVLSNDLDILYISNSVFHHIQITQVDIIGRNIVDYIHPDDRNELEKKIRHLFCNPCEMGGKFNYMSFTFRMYCLWNSKNSNRKKALKYKVMQLSGYLVPPKQSKFSSDYNNFRFVAIVQPLPSVVSLCELPLNSNVFIAKCGMDLKILFCEGQIHKYLDYTAKDLVGLHGYNFIYPDDASIVQTSHRDFLRTGKSYSAIYRFLNKYGGWIHLLTVATTLTKTKSNGEEEIEMLCLNYVHSDIEERGLVITDFQRNNRRLDVKEKRRINRSQESQDEFSIASNKILVAENNIRSAREANDLNLSDGKCCSNSKVAVAKPPPLHLITSNQENVETPICPSQSNREKDLSETVNINNHLPDCRGLGNIDTLLGNDLEGAETPSDCFVSVISKFHDGFSLPEISCTDILSILGPPKNEDEHADI